jgi:hypothetical protein
VRASSTPAEPGHPAERSAGEQRDEQVGHLGL